MDDRRFPIVGAIAVKWRFVVVRRRMVRIVNREVWTGLQSSGSEFSNFTWKNKKLTEIDAFSGIRSWNTKVFSVLRREIKNAMDDGVWVSGFA